MEEKRYIKLEDLDTYKLAVELSDLGWEIYGTLSWQEKKTIGDQFIRSCDSIGANIAEGYGRFHYADRNKFNYNARGSLFETIHWLNQMLKRKLLKKEQHEKAQAIIEKLQIKLNNYIASTREKIKK